jgi:hypothetical protein
MISIEVFDFKLSILLNGIFTHCSSTDHIIGGFPYLGSLKTIQHDGSPMGNVKINLCARLFSELESMRNYLIQNSHTFYSFDEDQIFALSEKLKDIR